MSSMANGSHNNSKTLAIRGKNQWFSFATAPEELRFGDSLKIRGTLGFDLYVKSLIWPSTAPVNVICDLLARTTHFHCRRYPDFIRGVTSKRRPFLHFGPISPPPLYRGVDVVNTPISRAMPCHRYL
ncbi:hypothetical protein DFH07DRAFT_769292 [Mycena maculata]|uniref:Uncharacterized protein n=1 Tax=Mycena maculata TaxID=230809 RepID=A0AAD7JPU1_9AGAR|nr:hypothetical protein DFH07DRAFT_769292 [Mycena maculata]